MLTIFGTVSVSVSHNKWKIAAISSMAPSVPPWIAGRLVLPIRSSWNRMRVSSSPVPFSGAMRIQRA